MASLRFYPYTLTRTGIEEIYVSFTNITLNPQPSTLNTSPSTFNLPPFIPAPRPCTLSLTP